jgi:hypothetical protein
MQRTGFGVNVEQTAGSWALRYVDPPPTPPPCHLERSRGTCGLQFLTQTLLARTLSSETKRITPFAAASRAKRTLRKVSIQADCPLQQPTKGGQQENLCALEAPHYCPVIITDKRQENDTRDCTEVLRSSSPEAGI